MTSMAAIVSVVGSYAALTSVLLVSYAHWGWGVPRESRRTVRMAAGVVGALQAARRRSSVPRPVRN